MSQERSDAEIIDRIEAVKSEDIFGFEIPDLIIRLPFDAARPYLKPEASAENWEQSPRDRDSVLKELTDYMPFAWDKANNCRGISAARSLYHMRAWLWLMGEDEFLEALDIMHYDHYGKPQLREVCEYLGIDWRVLDDDDWREAEEYQGPPADRVPRIAACEQFRDTA